MDRISGDLEALERTGRGGWVKAAFPAGVVGQFGGMRIEAKKRKKRVKTEKTGQTQFFRGEAHREISHDSPRKNWV
jgi:hypothetical protein